MSRILLLAPMFCLAVIGLGCSSDDSPTSSNGDNGRVVKNDPSLSNDIQEIFQRRGCTGGSCHGAAVSAGLDLRPDSAYTHLVNVDATSENEVRVVPGDAENSYLVIKLEGRQNVGQRMPAIGAPLDSIDLQNIKNWINQGAKDN